MPNERLEIMNAVSSPTSPKDDAKDDSKYGISLSLLESKSPESIIPDSTLVEPHLLVPPPLDWDLRARRQSLFWNLLFIFTFNFVAPTAIYYGLRYGKPDMDPSTVYAVVTAVLGTLELPFFPLRVKLLVKNGGERSALPDNPDLIAPHRTATENFKLMYLRYDVFQWQFLLGIFVVALCLSLASSLRGDLGVFWLLALTVPILVLEIGIQCFLSIIFYRMGLCSPVRLSSCPAGSRILPLLYYPVEDLTAVDGAGTWKYRLALSRRVRLSVPLRHGLEHLTLVCGCSFLLIFGASCAVVFAIDDDRISYGCMVALTVVPLVATILYGLRYIGRTVLPRERAWWAEGYGAPAYRAELEHEQRHGHGPDYSVAASIGFR